MWALDHDVAGSACRPLLWTGTAPEVVIRQNRTHAVRTYYVSLSLHLEQAMNITLSVDERIAEKARRTAQNMGKSLNQAVRDYLSYGDMISCHPFC